MYLAIVACLLVYFVAAVARPTTWSDGP